MFDGNAVSVSLDYLGQLTKANAEASEKIDALMKQNPELEAKYKEDVKSLEQMHRDTSDMIGLLFENMNGLGTREAGGYRYVDAGINRPVPYRWLRRAGQSDVANMIKNLRRLQLAEFAFPARRQKYGRDLGFSLVAKQPGREWTKREQKEIETWEARLTERFFYPPGDSTPNFAQFLGTCYADFFDLDDITIGIVRDRSFAPIAMQIQDPSLWVPTLPRVTKIERYDAEWLSEEHDPLETINVDVPEMDYLMVIGGMKQAACTRDMMIKSHFFRRSDWRAWKRGYSVQEQAVNVTTMILNAMTYNATNFTNNRTPRGVLAITGGYTNQLQLEKLKRVIWAQMSGVANQHKIPVVGFPEKGDAKWVNISGGTNKEMEFYTGITLFMSILFALSGTDPNELGLANFRDAVRSSGIGRENNDGIYKKSRDTGLNTFLSHMESTLNTIMLDGKNIWEAITGLPVVVDFQGIAEEDMKVKTDVQTKRLNVTASINELRQEDGLEAAKYDLGDGLNLYDIVGIGNTNVSSFIRQIMQQKQAEEQMQQQQQMMAAQGGAQGQGGPGAGGEQGGPQEYSDRDKELIAQFGEPEQSQEM